MIETANVAEKPTHYLVSQYRYPDGDQARFQDTASKYLTDLLIDDLSLAKRDETYIAEMNEAHRKRFADELEVLTAAADPNWTP